ncbi:hypothetical protein GII30_19220 [Gordonia amarae]|uniref:DUF8020 domain-containing protein n=2 Tax=Gordonia amarae TaxID=36821 RepID=G7GW03_9ACTN|nr:hypothetical protein [Gordonia amarae]MCS3880567.1 hypothetical protein [Gordonia amarae]QHN18890.1 hypothetical protein GII35_19580 [Gordonia amarae]QHN23365.1 hypothetical protein GII34_19080 [Gordonia amarae]QHN32265.1 hypothetical protein GII32_19390 [Gordonia amarae]QHN41013.1 hypothetical protein GII30_19220 [Gordonia amarae]
MQNLTGRTVVRVITASVLAIFAMTTAFMSTGGAAAAPAPKPVSYKLLNTGKGVKMHVGNGTITSDDGWLAINDTAGRKVFTMPLSYSIDKLQFPIDIRHNGKYDAVLTPSQDKARAKALSPAGFAAAQLRIQQDYAKKKKKCDKAMTDKDGYKSRQERDDAALNRVTSQLGTATAIGGFIGTVIGFIAGVPLFGVGGVAGAGIGGVVGTIIAGGPTLLYAATNYLTTLNTPFKATVCPR